MATLEQYQALGRIEGFAHARIAVETWGGLAGDDLIRADERRMVQIEQRAAVLMAAGGTLEQCQAFADAANGRFRDAFMELCVAASWDLQPDLFPQPCETVPAANRKARRATTSKKGKPK